MAPRWRVRGSRERGYDGRMTRPDDLVVLRPEGLYCPPGDFYIDPWRPVDRAVITHAHADHARIGHRPLPGRGSRAKACCGRAWATITLQTLAYGEAVDPQRRAPVAAPGRPRARVGAGAHGAPRRGLGGVGRLFSRASTTPRQRHLRARSSRCAATRFITESTFGLPIYRWQPQRELFADIDAWWRAMPRRVAPACCSATAFGKAQRILAGSIRPSARSSCTARSSR